MSGPIVQLRKKPVEAKTGSLRKNPIPLDYSFLDIKEIGELVEEESKCNQRQVVSVEYIGDQNKKDECERVVTMSGLVETNSMRLANNFLQTLEGFAGILSQIVTEPEKMSWFDLSCNQLSHIDAELSAFPELSVLYLHGNNIKSFKELHQLENLPLRSLTLHGSPLSQQKNYRKRVLMVLPHLKSLDFTAVTMLERESVLQKRRTQQQRSPSP